MNGRGVRKRTSVLARSLSLGEEIFVLLDLIGLHGQFLLQLVFLALDESRSCSGARSLPTNLDVLLQRVLLLVQRVDDLVEIGDQLVDTLGERLGRARLAQMLQLFGSSQRFELFDIVLVLFDIILGRQQ